MLGGELTDLQCCMGTSQFSVQWYNFHIMIFIFYDDGIFLFLLMSGMRQKIPWDTSNLGNDRFPKGAAVSGYLWLRKWDPGIFLSDKLCWKTFSLKGVHASNGTLSLFVFGKNLHVGLMEQVNILLFCTWVHALVLLHDRQI